MRQALLSALIFLAAFGLNLATLSPSVHPDDSPETVTAGATLSIQHPPGYPLHSMLGRLAVMALPGGAAFRVNLLSAFFGALGLLLFAHLCSFLASEFFGREGLLAVATLPTACLAFSYSLWFQSSIAKGGIYTLNFFLSSFTLLALLQARRAADPRIGLRLAALAFGLGMANHWTSQVVLLPGYALLLGEAWWRAGKPRPVPAHAWEALGLAGLAAAGLSLYLYLPLRALQHPVMSWGEPWTIKGFFWVFNRAQYAGLESGKSLAAFMALVMRIFEDLKYEFHGTGLLVIAGGWFFLFRSKPWLAAALLVMPLSLAFAVCLKANPPADSLWVIDPYLLPLYSGLALGLAGYFCLPAWMAAAPLALGAALLGAWHWAMADQSPNYLGYDYGKNLFLSAPKDSLLFCEGDSNTALPFYLRFVLGQRQDLVPVVTVLSGYSWYNELLRAWYPGLKLPAAPGSPPENIAEMAASNASRPVLITNSYTKDWVDPKRLVPRGLLAVIIPKGPPKLASVRANRIWEAYALRGVFAPAVAMDPLSLRLVRDNYKESPARYAYALQEAGDNRGAEAEFAMLGRLVKGWAAAWVQAGNCAFFAGDVEKAGEDWKRAVAEEPGSAEAMANLGLYYYQIRQFDESLSWARRALEKNPKLANAQDLLVKSRAMINQAGQPAPASKPQPLSPAQQWAAKGDSFAQKDQAKEALDAYDHAMALGFKNAGIFRNRAVMWVKLGDKAHAVTEMKAAVELAPRDAELRKYLGVTLYNDGQAEAAMTELKESQRLNPGDAQVNGLIQQVQAKGGP